MLRVCVVNYEAYYSFFVGLPFVFAKTKATKEARAESQKATSYNPRPVPEFELPQKGVSMPSVLVLGYPVDLN